MIRPVVDELSAAFWEGARAGRLVLQRCSGCRRFNHPPQVVCGWCAGSELEYREVPGDGRVHSYTSYAPSRGAGRPHLNFVVELAVQDGIFLIDQVADDAPVWLVIGAPVSVYFDAVDAELVLPRFRPSRQGAS